MSIRQKTPEQALSEERIRLLELAIDDAEHRLGQYLAHPGNTKSDRYAQLQIEKIMSWAAEIGELLA